MRGVGQWVSRPESWCNGDLLAKKICQQCCNTYTLNAFVSNVVNMASVVNFYTHNREAFLIFRRMTCGKKWKHSLLQTVLFIHPAHVSTFLKKNILLMRFYDIIQYFFKDVIRYNNNITRARTLMFDIFLFVTGFLEYFIYISIS